MSFIPHTPAERDEMLQAIGVESIDELFAEIPPTLRIKGLAMPDGVSEQEVVRHMAGLARRNQVDLVSFLGGGFYDHAIPAAVDALSSRGEFLTAYTPYQPEVAQGTLQAIFEYQSMICRLTGMDVANASMYDGGTALAEAVTMAVRATGRNAIVLAGNLNPTYSAMVKSFTNNLGLEFVELAVAVGAPLKREALSQVLNDKVAAVVVQNPDFYGSVDDYSDVAALVHQHGALLVASVYPISLGLLKQPGVMGVDIVTGEGQSLGLPLSFGGPYLGFLATRKALVRRMPGRVAGESVDRHGKRCFVLTLQAREQHIRREKATSNICTNQALCALRATIYLSLMGKQGLYEVAAHCAHKASYAQHRLQQIKGVKVCNQGATFNEFVLELPRAAEAVVAQLLSAGYAAGIPLSQFNPNAQHFLLMAVTEKNTAAEIDALAQALEALL